MARSTRSRAARRQHVRRLEKADEAEAFGAQVFLLGLRVDAHRVVGLWKGRLGGAAQGDGGAGLVVGAAFDLHALRGKAQAVEPVKGIADLFCLEAVCAELAAQLLGFGAGVAAPIVFVDKNEHFEHGPI
jgi:hypothetical protein